MCKSHLKIRETEIPTPQRNWLPGWWPVCMKQSFALIPTLVPKVVVTLILRISIKQIEFLVISPKFPEFRVFLYNLTVFRRIGVIIILGTCEGLYLHPIEIISAHQSERRPPSGVGILDLLESWGLSPPYHAAPDPRPPIPDLRGFVSSRFRGLEGLLGIG